MTDKAIEVYLNWIKENGGDFQNISLKDGCVYSTETINENDKFVTMPFKICINDQIARELLPALDNFPSRTVLGIYLAIQKQLGEKSFYWPYINILPKEIKTCLYFDDKDFTFLKNTNLEAATKTRKQELYDEFNQILALLPKDTNSISWEDYLWCYSMVSSRSFPYRLINPSTREGAEALFPLLDALNHKPNTKITWSTNDNSVSFIAGQAFNTGDQVFNNYGPKSNEELLIGYGFCFEHNEYDYVTLKPNFSQDLNFETKQNILSRCNVSSTNDSDPLAFYIHRNNIPENFLKLMRVLVMNSLETAHYVNCKDTSQLEFIGYRNELSMISTVLALLKNKLFALNAININEDGLTECQQYAVMYRKGQQDVYQVTISKMEEMKRNLILKMKQDQDEDRIAPTAPFLSISNPAFFERSDTSEPIQDDNIASFISLDKVVISLDQMLKHDKAFSTVISDNFEDISDEMDVVMTLALMKESLNPKSKWTKFFDRVAQSEDIKANNNQETIDELTEMYESVLPAFADAYPNIFNLDLFTFERFILADHILSNYSIDNPLVIVPL